MKKVPQSVDDILLDYLDGNLNDIDKKNLEISLTKNKVWKSRLEELRSVSSLLHETKLDQPSKNFTTLVMGKLDQYPETSGYSIRNGILLLTGVLLVVGIAIVLVSSGVFDNTTTSIDLNQVDISKKLVKDPLPSFQFSGKLIVNIIIVLNLALAWIVLDRTILKPLFQRRMQTGH
jgi:hypothetical protein